MTRQYSVALAGLAVAAAIGLAGCASATGGSTQLFGVTSNPVGARVSLSNGQSCDSTPCTFTVKRDEPFTVTVTKDGYKPGRADVIVQRGVVDDTSRAADRAMGGLIAERMDSGRSTVWPNPVVVQLQAQ